MRLASLATIVALCFGFATVSPAKDAAAPAKAPAKKAPAAKAPAAPKIKPNFENVPYGTHERQVLDVYQAKSDKPTPVVFYIHGGGWQAGDKASAPASAYLNKGLSVVAINYRYVKQAQEAGVKPPVEWPLHDAARALQFTRSKAKEWNLDPTRIGATGGSAGAASSLWLAFHPDMADPKSSDPVARESTRLTCAAVSGAQTCFDPKLIREWIPNITYGGHAYGFPGPEYKFEDFLAAREKVMPWILEYSPYHLVSKDDPPVLLEYKLAPPPKGETQKDATHCASFGVGLGEKIKSVGGKVYYLWPGAPDMEYQSIADFLVEKLTK